MDLPQTFPLKEVPQELWELIFRHEVALQPLKRLPSLLLAFSPIKESELYQEVKRTFEMVNAVVTERNQRDFKTLPMNELLEIRHLTLIFDKEDVLGDGKPKLNLKSHKSSLRNNFETITVDVTRCSRNGYSMGNGHSYLISYLVAASIPGVEKINVVRRIDQVLNRSRGLQRRPQTRQPSGYQSCTDVDGKRIFTWTKDDGKPIRKIIGCADFLGYRDACELV
ncbi:hypothetical protein EG329_002364 [Mollisiaceae sp. DMI_Dod_QoI]|nr:hypothetical protein EG329_002364 [Helotiales sp. DMI_Dod_QoI]